MERFDEVLAGGTAVVMTPVGSITRLSDETGISDSNFQKK
jgi:hypothetical protein